MDSLLQHKIFISTRPKGQSEELSRLLSGSGAELIEFPMIETEPVSFDHNLSIQLDILDMADWLVFTSANGVRHFFGLLDKSGKQNKLPEKIKYAVIGKKTAQVLSGLGHEANFVALKSTSNEFGQLLSKKIKTNNRVVVVLGNLASHELEIILSKKAEVTRMEVYRTIMPVMVDESILFRIVEEHYDQLIFTSPSGIKNFLLTAGGRLKTETLKVICIGETTAAFARESGIFPSAVADSPTADGIYKSILNLYNQS